MPNQNPQNISELTSYRRGLLLFTGAVCLALPLLAIIGHFYVKESTQDEIASIKHRSIANTAAEDAIDGLNIFEHNLLRYLLSTEYKFRVKMESSLERAGISLKRLKESDWAKQTADAEELAQYLAEDYASLNRVGVKLLNIRIDFKKWFPASKHAEQMLQIRKELSGLLKLVRRESSEDETTIKELKIISNLLQQWETVFAEARLLVANRFGAFSLDNVTAMHEQNENIHNYLDLIKLIEKDLLELRDQDKLSFNLMESLDEIIGISEAWRNEYALLYESLLQDNWRQDLNYLDEEVVPVIDRIRQRLSSIRFELDIQSSEDINKINNVAKSLSVALMVFALVGVLLAISGYFIIIKNVRPNR